MHYSVDACTILFSTQQTHTRSAQGMHSQGSSTHGWLRTPLDEKVNLGQSPVLLLLYTIDMRQFTVAPQLALR